MYRETPSILGDWNIRLLRIFNPQPSSACNLRCQVRGGDDSPRLRRRDSKPARSLTTSFEFTPGKNEWLGRRAPPPFPIGAFGKFFRGKFVVPLPGVFSVGCSTRLKNRKKLLGYSQPSGCDF